MISIGPKPTSSPQDELYTRLEDIQEDLRYYKQHFENKTVLCNCDDPFESNFFKYFALNFNFLKLKKLIVVGYENSPVMNEEFSLFAAGSKYRYKAYKIEINEIKDLNGDGITDLADIALQLKNTVNSMWLLNGNGDFRSYESMEILTRADIVVTHPPFSLFREYVQLLMNYRKKFLLIGRLEAAAYHEIFQFIKKQQLWLWSPQRRDGHKFRVPEVRRLEKCPPGIRLAEHKFIRVKNICWFTNLERTFLNQ